MTITFYIQVPVPDTIYPAQPLTGPSILLCPSDLREQLGDESQPLYQCSPHQLTKKNHSQGLTSQPLDQLQAIHWNRSGWQQSISLSEVSNFKMLTIPEYLSVMLNTHSPLY